MTAFPTTYPVMADGFRIEVDDGAVESRSDDGTLRIRRLWATSKSRITFRIGILTSVQSLAVTQFYRSYRSQTITWTNPFTSVVFNVVMTSEPLMVEMFGGLQCIMEIYMEGVEQ